MSSSYDALTTYPLAKYAVRQALIPRGCIWHWRFLYADEAKGLSSRKWESTRKVKPSNPRLELAPEVSSMVIKCNLDISVPLHIVQCTP